MAIPASPFVITQEQDDGSSVQLKIKGDERFQWQEDIDDYTVVRHGGNYFYATLNPTGKLVASPHRVGRTDPKALGLAKHLLPSKAVLAASRANSPAPSESNSTTQEAVSATGQIKNLVILIRFADHVGRSLPTPDDMQVLFNTDTPHPTLAPTGSLKAVYLQNSYGQMTLNSTINAWVTVSSSEAYYANSKSGDATLWQALREALTIIDANIDFNQYDQDQDGYIDSITFIHSGYGAEWGGDRCIRCRLHKSDLVPPLGDKPSLGFC